ncbi:MAG: hypothetical protein IIC01_12240 [Planctomycetes bacterium]|nr:hypothetical protein [Planctomycetota bacterium]
MEASTPDEAIVLTGCGWVTPFAHGSIAEVLTAARALPDHPEPNEPYWGVPDRFVEECPSLPKEVRKDQGAWMSGIALEGARLGASLEQHALPDDRVGLVLGCSLAGQLSMIDFANEVREQSARFVSPLHFPQTVGNYIAGVLARGYGLRGPNITIATGAASGLDALVEACVLLSSNQADVVLAGGTELLKAGLVEALAQPGERLSEGACWFALERAGDAASRGVQPLADIVRWDRIVPESKRKDEIGDVMRSTCSHPSAGAIFIEHWTGKCLAAGGPAAVAAAIGAASGLEVPIADRSDPSSASPTVFAVRKLTSSSSKDRIRSAVVAETDGPHQTVLELLIPSKL